MKRGICLAVFLIFGLLFLIINLSLVRAEVSVEVSVEVTDLPSLKIESPVAGTYLVGESLLLDYSVGSANTVRYNLDNSANTLIISPTYFDVSEGSHTLYLHAENSYGTTEREVSFVVDSAELIIIDNEYEIGDGTDTERKIKDGESTDFFDYSYEELQDLENVIFENTQAGKILFNEAINLIDDAIPDDNILDIDSHVEISENKIELDSVALPNFDKPATLQFYGLTFSNPRILMDGEICPASVCVKESYSGGVLTFNVPGFTTYTTEETPIESTTSPGGGGGGSSGGISREVSSVEGNFTLSQGGIKIKLNQGGAVTINLVVTNDGNQQSKFSIATSGLVDFIKVSDSEFDLTAGESKTINLDFLVDEDFAFGLYFGKLVVEKEGVKKEILIEIEVGTEFETEGEFEEVDSTPELKYLFEAIGFVLVIIVIVLIIKKKKNINRKNTRMAVNKKWQRKKEMINKRKK
jgi:hypothetical protein